MARHRGLAAGVLRRLGGRRLGRSASVPTSRLRRPEAEVASPLCSAALLGSGDATDRVLALPGTTKPGTATRSGPDLSPFEYRVFYQNGEDG